MTLKALTEEQAQKIRGLYHGNLINDDVENGLEIDGFISYDEMAAIVDALRQPSSTDKELFEQCWKAYDRKGSKKTAYERWKKLSDNERQSIVKHIPFYVKSNERKYLKDFERYISNKTFDNIVFDNKTGQVLYDPERESGSLGYTPTIGGSLMWNDAEKCYYYIGMFYDHIADGYTDDNRPDGARIKLNNGRGEITWSATNKQWEKV